MNKLFIGLLIIAAGTAVYLVFIKKNNAQQGSNMNERLIGKWRTDDSTRYYDFRDDGLIIRKAKDSLPPDTAHYSLDKNGELAWKTAANHDNIIYRITMLTADTLILQSADSISTIFVK